MDELSGTLIAEGARSASPNAGAKPPLRLSEVQPRQTLLQKVLFSRRLKLRCAIEDADMKMRFRRAGETFASQS